MNRLHQRLRDDGYTWEEADEIVAAQAEDRLDEERDRRMLEHFETIRRARELEDFDNFNRSKA